VKEETGPIDDLNLIKWQGRSVGICFDSDSQTNPKVREARDALAIQAYRRGARNVFNIALPFAQNGEKNGLDDFLQAHGVEALLDLDIQELPSPIPKIKLWTGPELLATLMERPLAIVKAWGIRRGAKVILTGAGGRGKSTLLLLIVCNLAAGQPLLGHAALEVTSPQRVAVLMAEDALSEIEFRWERQMSELGYRRDVAERIAFLDSQGARISLTNEDARQALFAQLRHHRADVCILDPLVAVHDADENSNVAMRGVLDQLTPFQEETGCSFILAHHEPKAPENNSAASRGASAIRDWCRTMLRLSPQKPSSDGSQRFQLELDKANYGGTVWSLMLEREQDSYLFVPIDPEEVITPREVWELVGPEGQWVDDVKKSIMEKRSVSESTAYRAIKKAEELKLVVTGQRINAQTKRSKSYVTRGAGPEGEE